MTEQIFDDRASSYVGAREALKAAAQIKARIHPAVRDTLPLPDSYWGNLLEAAILAHLATADPTVGLLAGNYLVEQEKRVRRNKSSEIRDRLEAKRGTNFVAPFAEGHDVRLTRGDWAGRHGKVYRTHPHNQPPMLDVELDPPGRPDDPNEPVMVTVPTADVELDPPKINPKADAEHRPTRDPVAQSIVDKLYGSDE